jgi:cysteine-rich repeat protein
VEAPFRSGLAAIGLAMTTALACTYDYDGFGNAGGASTTGGPTSSASGGPASGSTASASTVSASSGDASAATSASSGGGGSGVGPGGGAAAGTGGGGGDGGSTSTATTGTGGAGGSGGSATTSTGTGGDGGFGGSTSSASTGTGGEGGTGPVCGDGVTEAPEECDDDELVPGDGCGITCLEEEPDACPGTPIPLDVGTLVISDDTFGASDTLQDSDGQGPCTTNPSAGPDFIYAVMPSSNGTLTATLDAGFDYHWLRARLGCPSGAELDCDYAYGEETDIAISFSVQAGGTYYVVVDSWGGTQGGSFELTLQLAP